jgi:hypothetical protein
MDVYKTMTSINNIGKYLLILIISVNVIFAADSAGVNNIKLAMQDLCSNAQMLLGGAALVLIVLAAVVYAIGQVTGAETRARASVWATAMIIGALVGIAIYLLVPTIIRTLLTGQCLDATKTDPCDFGAVGAAP